MIEHASPALAEGAQGARMSRQSARASGVSMELSCTGAGVAIGTVPGATESVARDDRSADREPHAHSTGLGGEERIEEARHLVWIESDPGVLHGYEDGVG